MTCLWVVFFFQPHSLLTTTWVKALFWGLTAFLLILLIPLPYSPVDLLNVRLTRVFIPYTVIVVGVVFKEFKFKPKYILLIGLVYIYSHTLDRTRVAYAEKGFISLAKTMDWFYRLPDSQSNLMYADYAIKPVVMPNERFQAQSFIATQYPWHEQWELSKCPAAYPAAVCLEKYRQAIARYHPRYLLIDASWEDPTRKLLQTLGQVIEIKGMTIVKL
jgi:hypothetical protein